MDTLKESDVLWTHIKTEILEPSSAFDHLLLKKCVQLVLKESICNVQQSIGKMQMTLEGHNCINFLIKRGRIYQLKIFLVKCYLGRFDALARLSAARSTKYFKTKRIRDDFMFDKKMMDEEMVKATKKKVLDELKSMDLTWTKEQKERGKEGED